MYKNISCANCGERGHILKECTGPITSYGLIAYKIVYSREDEQFDKNDELMEIFKDSDINTSVNNTDYPKIKLLMIQRKDTIGYTDFLRGKYKKNALSTYFTEMTKYEQDKLLKLTFRECWDKLWVRHESNGFKNEFEYAKNKFSSINIKDTIDKYKALYSYPEWSFPKGRKNVSEYELKCAEREFCEETGFKKYDYKILSTTPLVEDFIGTDNIHYKHIYYIAKMPNDCIPRLDESNIQMISEVGNIGFLNYNECLEIIRPYDWAKKNIVKEIFDIINKMKPK